MGEMGRFPVVTVFQAGGAQRLGQPAGIGQQDFRFGRHFALLQMPDPLGGALALGLGHRLQDAGLGNATEVVVHRRLPARPRHVERDGAGQPVGMGERMGPPVPRFLNRIHRQANHMGEQAEAAVGFPALQHVPEIGKKTACETYEHITLNDTKQQQTKNSIELQPLTVDTLILIGGEAEMSDIHNPNIIELKAETINLLDEVTASISALNEKRPFGDEVESRITREFLPDRVTASLNIEGIAVTRRQTLIMMDAMTLSASGSKQERELLNALKADEFVFDLSKNEKTLTSITVRQINQLLQDEILDSAGSYREKNVEISGARFQPPDHSAVGSLMTELLDTYEQTKSLHPVLRAAWLHASFTHIHPFIDGNGRTGRLIQDFSLLCDGLYPTGIPSHLRDNYYDSLEAADSGNWDPLCQMICESQLGIVSRVKSIIDEVRNRGEFISQLVSKAAEKKTGTLHKQYTVWRQRMDNFISLMVKTCSEINASSDIIQIRSETYDIIDFEKWKRVSDRGGAEHTWAIKQTWYVDGEPLYRTVMYFKRHNFRSEDPFSRDDLYGNVTLRITGGEPRPGMRLDFDNFADPLIRFREALFVDGTLYTYQWAGNFRVSNNIREEVWECEQPPDSSIPIQDLIKDIFLKKLGIGT